MELSTISSKHICLEVMMWQPLKVFGKNYKKMLNVGPKILLFISCFSAKLGENPTLKFDIITVYSSHRMFKIIWLTQQIYSKKFDNFFIELEYSVFQHYSLTSIWHHLLSVTTNKQGILPKGTPGKWSEWNLCL